MSRRVRIYGDGGYWELAGPDPELEETWLETYGAAPPAPEDQGRPPAGRSKAARQLRILDSAAEFWAFVIAKRDWWARADQRRYAMGELARQTLVETLGIAAGDLAEMSDTLGWSGILEVVLPHASDPKIRRATRWARVMPWEYLATAAMHQGEDAERPTIVRRLEVAGAGQPANQPTGPRRNRKILYVESRPGVISEYYTFETEQELPGYLGRTRFPKLVNPSLTVLRNRVRQLQPDVIHLAGIDSHQACYLIDDWQMHPGDVVDGMVLRGRGGKPEAVPAAALAKALCAGRKKPELVLFNLYNSAGDLGYEAVAAGAEAAVGFQHAVDDALAEAFVAELYRMLGPRELPLAAAVVAARQRLGASAESRHGTGFVIWSRYSRWQERVEVEDEKIEEAITDREDRTSPGTQLSAAQVEKLLRPSIEPYSRINYALLHNRRPLFRRFEIRNLKDQVVPRLQVEVALQVGNQSYPCRLQHDLHTRVTDFRDMLRLPLIWELDTLPGERAQTTLTTQVRWGDRDLLVRTDPVVLQPIDLWVDDDVNRQWLPSFVLPRDPAVRKVIAAAQRYLDALSDDYSAGFDGYQSVDLEAADPYAGVDAQVQAIWNALVLDFAPRYVNPPPTFELLSQRLRSPSDLLEGGRGTCIDLALLLAACLEYVEIFPAIFLLEGHAFVGYWRSDDGYYDAVDQMLLHPAPDEDLDLRLARHRFGVSQRRVSYPWVYDERFYRPVFNLVHRRQQLVPLEATGIPFRTGFWEAVDQGSENLRSLNDFHSLIDLVAARDHAVTPLPFGRREP